MGNKFYDDYSLATKKGLPMLDLHHLQYAAYDIFSLALIMEKN